MVHHRAISILTLAGALLSFNGCEKKSPSPPAPVAAAPSTNYTVNGVIVQLSPEKKQAVIKHEAIPNYMDAMTMPFPIKDVAILRGLQTNDAVRFQFTTTETEGWISKIEKRTSFIADVSGRSEPAT